MTGWRTALWLVAMGLVSQPMTNVALAANFAATISPEGILARLMVEPKDMASAGGQLAFQVDPILLREKTETANPPSVEFLLVQRQRAHFPPQIVGAMSTRPNTRIVLTFDKDSPISAGPQQFLFGNNTLEARQFGLFQPSPASCTNLDAVRYKISGAWNYFTTNMRKSNDGIYVLDCPEPSGKFLAYSVFASRTDFYKFYTEHILSDIDAALKHADLRAELGSEPNLGSSDYASRLQAAYRVALRWKLLEGNQEDFYPRPLAQILSDRRWRRSEPSVRSSQEYGVLMLALARLFSLDLDLVFFFEDAGDKIQPNRFPVPLTSNGFAIYDAKSHRYLPISIDERKSAPWRIDKSERYGEIVRPNGSFDAVNITFAQFERERFQW